MSRIETSSAIAVFNFRMAFEDLALVFMLLWLHSLPLHTHLPTPANPFFLLTSYSSTVNSYSFVHVLACGYSCCVHDSSG